VLDAEGNVYVGVNNQLHAFAPDGRKKWAYGTGDLIEAAPALCADGSILIGSRDGSVRAVNSEGQFKWVASLPGPVMTTPTITRDGKVLAVSAFWLAKLQGTAPPALSSWPQFQNNAQRTGRLSL
jgi:outer membrane protein assembly factor BamB